MIKRILAPVLALVAFGMTASASIVPYCDGYCGMHDTASFNTAVTLDGYTYASGTDLAFSGSLSDAGLQYVDGATSVMFAASSAFTINSLTLVTAANQALTISVPAAYGAIQLSLSQTGAMGLALIWTDGVNNDSTYLSSSPSVLDYLNTAPGSNWTITLNTGTNGEQIIVDGFNPAGVQSQGSDTPEVGTLLLIGAGLISMRWMRRAQLRFSGPPQTA